MNIPKDECKRIYEVLRDNIGREMDIEGIRNIINLCYEKIKDRYNDIERIKKYVCRFIYDKKDKYEIKLNKDREKSKFKIDDDILTETELRRQQVVKELKAIVYPAQRTIEWLNQRKAMITASDGGTVLDMNEHEDQYKFIVKKISNTPFMGNKFCYHGKKYEKVALMIYEERMKVKVADFGLVQHKKYPFLGASPDGIVECKDDGVSDTKYVGRMIEIKCPLSRKIKTSGKNICPLYYWVQVQLQLETCDLDECDFWQCSIMEYETKEDFEEDTNETEPWISKKNKLEKGCLIQLIKKNITDYNVNLFEHAIFVYHPLHISPKECDKWINAFYSSFDKMKEYSEYKIDKVIYWKAVVASCYLIKRDKEWFNEHLKKLERMWDYVTFFRKNDELKNILIKFIEKSKDNNEIMEVIENLYNGNKEIIKEMKEVINSDGYIPPE